MEEEEKKPDEEEKVQEEDKPKNMIEKAEEQANRIEEGNKKTEELLQRQEVAEAKRMLGGTTEAGTEQVKEPETISNKDYAIAAAGGKYNETSKPE